LRAVQAETLAGREITWLDGVQHLPDQPLFLLANEFFDALPIRQFRRDGTGWREIRVGAHEGRLHPGLGQRQPQPALAHRAADTRDGDIVELCPTLPAIMGEVAARIARHGGAALVVDYGGWRSLGDTFQALRGHARADPFDAPGSADLTAHVDFEALARAAAPPLSATPMTAQGVFLERLGITARAQALARGLTGPRLDELVAAHRRLTHPEEMGHLFQVMGFHPAASAPLPGLHP
jgi:SAM-dependent MidA family methyltransferase